MRKFATGVLVGVVFSLTLVALAGEVFYKGKKVWVIAPEENLRAAPNGKKLGSVLKGTPMIVIEDGQKWVQVAVTGFIWKESITGRRERLAGEAYRALMIIVKTEKEAQDLLTRIQAGEDFAVLAREHSIDAATARRGGDLGEFYKGELAPEIEKAILSIKPNEVSGIVKTAAGYAIFKRVK